LPALREVKDGDSVCEGDIASNYAYNGELAWRAYPLVSTERSPSDIKLVKVKNSSKVIALVETRAWWPDLRTASILGRGEYPGSADDGAGYFGYWHDRKANWAFMDGHVEWLSLLQTKYPRCLWYDAPGAGAQGGDWRLLVAKAYR
jgi:prepilin-type processing-associated H-X9-DG protein